MGEDGRRQKNENRVKLRIGTVGRRGPGGQNIGTCASEV